MNIIVYLIFFFHIPFISWPLRWILRPPRGAQPSSWLPLLFTMVWLHPPYILAEVCLCIAVISLCDAFFFLVGICVCLLRMMTCVFVRAGLCEWQPRVDHPAMTESIDQCVSAGGEKVNLPDASPVPHPVSGLPWIPPQPAPSLIGIRGVYKRAEYSQDTRWPSVIPPTCRSAYN